MPNVVELPPLARDTPVITHTSLRRLSRILTVLFTLIAVLQVLWVIAAAVVMVFFADHVLTGAQGAFLFSGKPPAWNGTVLLSTQPPVTRIAAMIDIVMATTPIFFAFWNLRSLFSLYARGQVFARENADRLKRVGLWLVVYPFAKVAANMLFQLAGGTDKAWFHMELIYALVTGLIVFAIAQVMEFGREIEQEKDSFV